MSWSLNSVGVLVIINCRALRLNSGHYIILNAFDLLHAILGEFQIFGYFGFVSNATVFVNTWKHGLLENTNELDVS